MSKLLTPFLSSLVVLCFIFLQGFQSWSQDTFEWYDGKCLFHGKIDTTKARYGEVSNVFYVIINPYELNQPYLAYEPKDTVYLNKESLLKASKSYVEEIKAMDFPKTGYWKNLREQKIKEIEQLTALKAITIEALYNPKVLKKTKYYKSCKVVCKALIHGGDELFMAWKDLVNNQINDAYEPEVIREAFQMMWNSPNRELYARMELLRYVWYQSASAQINTVLVDSQLMLQFSDLMTEVNSTCH